MKVRGILLAAILLFPAAAQARQHVRIDAPACAIDRAVYRLQGAAEFTAGFARRKHPMGTSDLLFWIKTPKRTYWFEFQSPNGYGGTWIAPSVAPALLDADDEREDGQEPAKAIREWQASAKAAGEARDPLQNITFDAFDRELMVFGGAPQSNHDAPARIFMRGIGQALWYSYTWAAAGDETAEQESIPTRMWEPYKCA